METIETLLEQKASHPESKNEGCMEKCILNTFQLKGLWQKLVMETTFFDGVNSEAKPRKTVTRTQEVLCETHATQKNKQAWQMLGRAGRGSRRYTAYIESTVKKEVLTGETENQLGRRSASLRM